MAERVAIVVVPWVPERAFHVGVVLLAWHFVSVESDEVASFGELQSGHEGIDGGSDDSHISEFGGVHSHSQSLRDDVSAAIGETEFRGPLPIVVEDIFVIDALVFEAQAVLPIGI